MHTSILFFLLPAATGFSGAVCPDRNAMPAPRRQLSACIVAQPSATSHELDRLLDNTVANLQPPTVSIIRPYDAEAWWLWSQWAGTVASLTWPRMLISAATAAGTCVAVTSSLNADWPSFVTPGPLLDGQVTSEPIVAGLQSLGAVWEYQLTLCTFVVTFFLNQAWVFRNSIYSTCRNIQGCTQDIVLLLSLNAARDAAAPCGDGDGREGPSVTSYTSEAQALLDDVGRYVRLAHVFFWSARGSQTPRYLVSQSAREMRTDQVAILGSLLSEAGLERLVAHGELTQRELDVLRRTGLPPERYAYVLLEWVGLHVVEARDRGVLRGGAGLERAVLERITSLRGQFFTIGDALDFRSSMAYVQFVQILVDTLVLVAPFALYPRVGAFSVPLAALITYFYCGLLELSKSFFDIFGREGYYEQTISVDVLIREVNYAASTLWRQAGSVKLMQDERGVGG